MVLNDESKKPIDFGDAAPSVLYCIVSEVILLCMVCEHCNCYRLIFKFAMKVHHDKAKKPIITCILGECYPLQIARCRRDRQWRYTCLTLCISLFFSMEIVSNIILIISNKELIDFNQ